MDDLTLAVFIGGGALVLLLGYQTYQLGGLDNVTSALTGRLSAQQIAQYAAAAGFQGDDLVTAVAIALAESSGNPNAYNPETAANTPMNQGSYGLWQIYLKVHPEYANVNLYDPQTNANAAFDISQQQGWSAWSTYKGNEYLAHVPSAQAGVQANG